MASEILIVMLIGIALAIFAERHRLQSPLVLVFVGLLMSFIPGMVAPSLEPETILSIVVPPLLYSAALDFSFFSFVKRLSSILNLSVALVFVTTVAVGFAAVALVPALPLSVAFILGAALAPPDAVSAVSIGRELGLPGRLMTVLKGESLVNDAAALALFGVATAWALSGAEHPGGVIEVFLYAAVVGSLIGMGLGQWVDRIRRRLENPNLVTTLSVLVPFTAYALAEWAHASGVMAVVFAGFTLSHRAADLGFAGRIQEREVWRVVDALLETFAFAYMGLQLRPLVLQAQANGHDPWRLALAALALLGVVIVVRIAWIALSAVVGRLRYRIKRSLAERLPRLHQSPQPLSWGENAVLGWAGMRGVVTLAAAAATPLQTSSGAPLAGRSAIVLIAYVVALGTLLLHGLTLPALVRRLRLPADDAQALQRQKKHAKAVMRASTQATLGSLRHEAYDEQDLTLAARLLTRQEQAAEPVPGEPGVALDEAGAPQRDLARRARVLAIGRSVLSGQRAALIAERDAQRLDDEILRELLEGLDLEQALLAQKSGHLVPAAGAAPFS